MICRLSERALEGCRTIKEFEATVQSHVIGLGSDAASIVGNRLAKFAQRIKFKGLRFFSDNDPILRELQSINAISNEEDQWVRVAQVLSSKTGSKEPIGLPLPTRPAYPLDRLIRSGVHLPKPPADDNVQTELGITGLEFGNYVSNRESGHLVRLLAEALTDLRHILGDWIVPLSRSGNLSIALGARGKGKSCAHYEPALRVINLTKARGDGSLAHEFAHFLDHMLASHAPDGESRFLSSRVHRLQTTKQTYSRGYENGNADSGGCA